VTKFADLHIHTHYSDSTSSPQEVVEESLRSGLSCIAITDHDTLEGIMPAQEAAQAYDLEIIPGVELSADADGSDLHILGYYMDLQSGPLLAMLKQAQTTRVCRIQEMISKLKPLGVDDIELNEVRALTQSDSVGRLHLATILKEKGFVSNLREAFDKYLGEDSPAYVPKHKISPVEAIRLIRQSGGIAVLAHPMVTNKDELIPHLAEAGLQGLEIYYPNYPEVTRSYYQGLADKYHLIVTGGSDAHGKGKTNTFIGKVKLPYECVEKMKQLK